MCALTDEGEELFIRVKLFREELVRETEALRATGGSAFWPNGSDINEIRDYFDVFMGLANRPAAAVDSRERKYPSWTYCVEYVCGKIQP